MKLPQGPAAYGTTAVRSSVPQTKVPTTDQTAQSQSSNQDDATRIALSRGAETSVPLYSRGGAPSAQAPVGVNRQAAANAYARASSQSNPFAATVAAFNVPRETPPASTPSAPTTPAAKESASEQTIKDVAAEVQNAARHVRQAETAKPQVQAPKPSPVAVKPERRVVDDDEEFVYKPVISPELEALAVRYVDNYSRQTNKPMTGEDKKKMIADVSKFYGEPSRAGRLEALVRTQDDVAA